MGDLLYRASFYLYEISFLLMGAALLINSLALRKINHALNHPPYWIWTALGALLLAMVALNHYHVYHNLSPLYLKNNAQELLIRMYLYKTVSMFCILGAGACLGMGPFLYLLRIRQR